MADANQKPKNMLEVAAQQMANVPEGFSEVKYKNPLEKEGDAIQGTFLGKGSTTIKSKLVNTYRVEDDNGAISVVIGAHQIDQFMERVKEGDEVYIKRGKEIKAGANGRVTEYITGVKRNVDN